MTEAELQQILEGVPVAGASAWVYAEDRKLNAWLTASGFEGVDNAERQHIVWQYLLEHLTPEQRRKVAYIATWAPGEVQKIAQERLKNRPP